MHSLLCSFFTDGAVDVLRVKPPYGWKMDMEKSVRQAVTVMPPADAVSAYELWECCELCVFGLAPPLAPVHIGLDSCFLTQ